MGKIQRFFREAVGTILDIWDIISLISGIGGEVGAVLIQLLVDIPFYYPLILGIVSFSFIVYGITKTIIAYKKWKYISETKTAGIDDIINHLLGMHIKLGEMAKPISNRRLSKKAKEQMLSGFLKLINMNAEELARLPFTERNDKLLQNKMKKVLKLKSNKIHTSLNLFIPYGRTLDRNNVGLSNARKTDKEYKPLYEQLLHKQIGLHLPIQPRERDVINDAYQMSYGIHSIGLAFMLIGKYGKAIQDMPERYPDGKDDYIDSMNSYYIKTLSWARNQIMKSYLKEYKE